MQKISFKNSFPLPRNRKKKTKNIDRLLIGRKFYDIRDHVRSKSFIGFKWEIGCTVPKNSHKSDVRCEKNISFI